MGKGVVIELIDGVLYVLVDGEVVFVFLIGYVVGLNIIDGVEILMYIGMDIVELEGKGFEMLV